MVLQYTILCLGYGAFGVTTIFNFPSKSYVKFSFCQRNQWSMRLGPFIRTHMDVDVDVDVDRATLAGQSAGCSWLKLDDKVREES